MNCPKCGKEKAGVRDSRPQDGGRVIKRRRRCEGCGNRFSTYEITTRPKDLIRLDTIKEAKGWVSVSGKSITINIEGIKGDDA